VRTAMHALTGVFPPRWIVNLDALLSPGPTLTI
jgi:hypothetical protein